MVVSLSRSGLGGAALPARNVADPFDRLFLQEYPRLVAIAARVLRDRAAAEDVAQEVFLQFHRRHSPEADYAPAWLHAAAAHTALNKLRGDRRRMEREMRLSGGREQLSEHPEAGAEALETQRLLRAALARLPERSAVVLAMRYSGLSYAEIATAMRTRVGNVGTMLRRAEEALRREVNRATSR